MNVDECSAHCVRELAGGVVPCAVVLLHAVRVLLFSAPASNRLPAKLGPLDKFRVFGAFLLAFATAAFTYGDERNGLAVDSAPEWADAVWTVGSSLGFVTFATLCSWEASALLPESGWLRLYWVLQLVGWGEVVVTHLANDPGSPQAALFFVVCAAMVTVASSYLLFAAQQRFGPSVIRLQSTDGYATVPGDALLDDKAGALLAASTVAGAATSASDAAYSPEVRAGPLSVFYFTWLTGMILKGYSKPLEESDLWPVTPSDDPTALDDKFRAAWAEQLRRPQPSLLRALVSAFGRTYFFGALLKFMYDTQQFIGPLLLQAIIENLNYKQEHEDDPHTEMGLGLVGLLLLNAMTQSIFLHQYFHAAFRTGMRVKSSMISAIYAKALKVKPGAPEVADATARNGNKANKGKGKGKEEAGQKGGDDTSRKSTGEIVNLMSVDAQRLQDTMSYIAMLWSGVYQIALALYYLFSLLGLSTLAGVAVMIFMVPVTAKVAKVSRSLQKAVMEIKDERIKVENEVLGGMKIIKLYAWEQPYADKITNIRNQELRSLWKYKCFQVASRVLWTIVPTLVSISTFAAYSLEGHELTAAEAFTSLALFNILRFPLATLPMAIASCVEAGLSIDRIQAFLLASEVVPLPSLASTEGSYDAPAWRKADALGDGSSSGGVTSPLLANGSDGGNSSGPVPAQASMFSSLRVDVQHASLRWDDGTKLLDRVDLNLSDGELLAVLGHTGSGKSGLLSALIGELVPAQGTVRTNGSIAYVSQVAWIQNATLRDNILFGRPFDPLRYFNVLQACALLDDLAILPGADMTEIGEKGINLSGGQKQRVAIARAVYSDADLYLLDDCLSAVDSQVAHHIFDNVITGLLRTKAVLLVTHNLQLVPQVDAVMLLDDGKVQFNGPLAAFLTQPNETALAVASAAENGNGHPSDGDSSSQSFLVAPLTSPSEAVARLTELGLGGFGRSSAAPALGADDGRSSPRPSGADIISKETLDRGDVQWATYQDYVSAGGTVAVLVFVIGGLVCYNIISAVSSWWLGYWSDHGDKSCCKNQRGLEIYILLSFVGVFFTFAALLAAAGSGQRACRVFHERLVSGIIGAKMAFFDTTPLGRIVNRFSKDVYTIDEQLPVTMYSWLSTLCAVLTVIATIAYVTPWFLLACVPLGYVYYKTQQLYIPTARELKRLDSVLRSPIFSKFGETLEGASTIRAFRAEAQFTAANMFALERNLRAYYANIASNRWLALRLEFLGAMVVTLASLLAVLGNVSAGNGGLSITYALSITQTLNWFVRMSSDREAQIVAVERVNEYAQVEGEAPAVVPDYRPQPSWPEEGKISFRHTSMRYRPGLKLVLKSLDLEINAQQKVGVVGRTGAGKSSLLLVLLRLVEPATGDVIIDGVDAVRLGLFDLRSRVSIIPQDPVLFTGTVRFNLDPFNQHDDEAVWHALERSHLAKHIRTLPSRLHAEVEEAGRNFSMGERQLLCLARALLRRSRILLLDEATSAVDQHTDQLVQETIRSEFEHCTVLTIAHRLDTIIDYDRVLVLADGTVAEDGNPQDLIQREGGLFKSMWEAHQKGQL